MKTDRNHSQLMNEIRKGSSSDEKDVDKLNDVRAETKFGKVLEKIVQKVEEIEAPINPEIINTLNELKEHFKNLTEEDLFLLDSTERIKGIENIYNNLLIIADQKRKDKIEE